MTPVAYLDYNATAPVRPAAAAAVAAALEAAGNASSVHAPGRAARRRIEDARERVAALVGAAPANVVFTSGGTEANALALTGSDATRLLVSAVEHDSVLRNAPGATPIPVDRNGVVDLAALDRLLAEPRGETCLVSLMLANNETGVIQPVAEAAAIARAHGARMHCDAVQAAGKIAVDIAVLGVDMLTLSAHKIGGPQGVGALVLRDGMTLAPLLKGGGQERGRRAGTENLPGIAGFGAAAAAALADLAAGAPARIAALRDGLEAALAAPAAIQGAVIHGAGAARLPNTSCIGLPGRSAETQVMALDLAGVAVSSGAACSSGKVRASHVLGAMGLSAADAGCAIRVSLGWASTQDDVDRFVAAWGALAARGVAAA
jgi:cysteine desulfurase